MKKVRDCLQNEFVPQHLGFDHITRNEVIERNLTIPKRLFFNEENTKAIIICDGTYLHTEGTIHTEEFKLFIPTVIIQFTQIPKPIEALFNSMY